MRFNIIKPFLGAVFLTAIILTACNGGGGAAAPVTFTIGGTVSGFAGTGLVLQNNNADDLTITANGVFAFTTKSANGASYSVTIKTQPSLPSQTCTINNGSGTVADANITSVTITCPVYVRFAYVANNTSNDISVYTIDATTGALTQVACTGGISVCNVNNFLAGSGPYSVSVDPSVKFAYVANNSSDVTAYTIDATTGALTQVACTGGVSVCNANNFLAGTYPYSVTVDPSGKFVYVANLSSGDVSAYTINATTGALTQVACTGGVSVCNANNFLAGSAPASVTVDSLGKYVYVANVGSNDVSAYTINATTGALTQVACTGGVSICNVNNFLAGSSPNSVIVDPSGKFVYVANNGSGDVSAYNINAATGALTKIACTGGVSVCNANNFLAGSGPYSISVDPSGKFAYVANANSSDVSAYTINATTGVLTQVACTGGVSVCNGNNFLAGSGPHSVSIDPSGKFAYTANNSNDVSAYTINATTGALTQIACTGGVSVCNGNNFLAGTGPTSVSTTGKFQ